ncbi:MAG: hypothetical protein KGO92_14855 [Bacteroidota bacterium]|nr:hypothetical protein [Bacteroidota bacterium]
MKRNILFAFGLMAFLSCNQLATTNPQKEVTYNQDWKSKFDQMLPLLGHRNWIIVVDKAFPLQNAAGMEVIHTNEKLLPVLQRVLREIDKSGHVKAMIYRDKELGFVSEDQARGVKRFIDESIQLFKGQQVQTLLHDSVFTKLDETSKLFKVLVLKTDETIPYSSVFLQLDCAYWDAGREKLLRERMNTHK